MISFFSHDTGARNDEKITELVMRHGWESYGIYWAVIELMFESGGKLLQSKRNAIAYQLHCDTKKFNTILDSMIEIGLVQTSKEHYWSNRVLFAIEEIEGRSNVAKLNAKARWDKHRMQLHSKGNATAKQAQSNGNANKEYNNKENKEEKEEKETPPDQIDPNSLTREKNLQTFHHFWEAYEKKNGQEKTFEAWITMSLEDQRKALKGAKIYKENEPDSQFRSNPERYLTGKEWLDEKATKKKQPKKDKFPRASLGIDRPFCEPKEVTS